MKIKGLNIVITGVAQGIGLRTAVVLGRLGARIYGIDLNSEKLGEFRQIGVREGLEFFQYKGDVSKEVEVVNIFEAIAGATDGKIDVLINNAGITRDNLLVKVRDGITKFPLNDWNQVIDVNLTGVFLCAREAAYHMVKAGNPGVIINMSSVSRHGNIGQSNYSASKAGVAALTVVWSKELAKYNIRVVGIAPGFMKTGMTEKVPPKVLERIKQQIPVGDLGEPDNIAETIKFIIENDYINGRVLEIDGGLRL
jgi:3-oxoacyl-[acyl-carrier protein] reductase